MGATISRGEYFDAKLTSEIFNKVKGRSTIAQLHGADPIPFNGVKEFTFSMDSEVDIVAENGAKSNGGATIAPVVIVPLKIEYGARVSDEFLYASDEEAIDLLKSWSEGFARKAARGLDLMAIHGINPRTGTAATLIDTNSFDTNTGVQKATRANNENAEELLERAIALIGENDVTGYAFAKTFATELSKIKENGVSQYPEFKLGANPGNLGGAACDVNSTVSNGGKDLAVVGDFVNAFKWGVAKDLPLEVIEYGCPDNNTELGDLKGHNQVYIRSEMYIGWGILDPAAFAVAKEA
jgi:hypothetical protein